VRIGLLSYPGMIVVEGSVRVGRRELSERKRECVALACPEWSAGLA
jgi:hypothetical protein